MNLELRPAGSTPQRGDLEQIEWGAPGAPSDVLSSVDPWLTQLGTVGAAATDLARIAAAAYLADRLSPRGVGYSRTLEIHVQLTEPNRWSERLAQVEGLLTWLANDEWHLSVGPDGGDRPALAGGEVDAADYEVVALFSGGLDSFCGALLGDPSTVFLSHSDNAIVSGSQKRAWKWLVERDLVVGAWHQIQFRESGSKRERSTRTRALLFYALALAVADALGLDRVDVPENGFTSLNVALGNERGGALSTRSTHPFTMQLLRSLLVDLGIGIAVANPYEAMTKGELVAAAASSVEDFASGAAATLSCAKLDGRFVGGSSHTNCGLCVACLTRRGGLLAAKVEDSTPYLLTTLQQGGIDQLRRRRADDLLAVRRAVALAPTFDEFDLVAQAQLPDAYDFEAGADLLRRGFAELSLAVEAS